MDDEKLDTFGLTEQEMAAADAMRVSYEGYAKQKRRPVTAERLVGEQVRMLRKLARSAGVGPVAAAQLEKMAADVEQKRTVTK